MSGKGLIVTGQRAPPPGRSPYARLVFQGATLRTLRERRSLTLRALAQRLGVTYQAVHNWEKGTNDPSADLLPALASELGCEIGDLYLAADQPSFSVSRAGDPDRVANQDFLQELFAALLQEGVPRQSAEEARDLAARTRNRSSHASRSLHRRERRRRGADPSAHATSSA